MAKKLYSKIMVVVPFLFAILKVLKDPKAIGGAMGMTALIGGGGLFMFDQVNAKHYLAMAAVAKNSEKVIQMTVSQEKILVTLEGIRQSIDETKLHVKQTNDRVWQILMKKEK